MPRFHYDRGIKSELKSVKCTSELLKGRKVETLKFRIVESVMCIMKFDNKSITLDKFVTYYSFYTNFY